MELQKQLHEKIEKALDEKYQGRTDPRIQERADAEWSAVLSHGMVQEIALLLEICQYLHSNGLPWVVTAAGGSSFLLYLLGITRGNPLPAHLLDTETGRVTWWDDVFRDGFDIPKGQTEGTAGLSFDGHDIDQRLLFGFGTGPVRISLKVPKTAASYLATMPLPGDVERTSSLSRFGYPRVQMAGLDLYCSLEDKNSHQDVSYQRAPDILLYGQALAEKYHLPEPETVSEVIYLAGICDQQLWSEAAAVQVRDLGFGLDDLLVFRDDYYRYLIRHGIPGETAFQDLKRPSQYTEEMDRSGDKWMHYEMKRKLRTFPKAHVVEEILYRLDQKGAKA